MATRRSRLRRASGASVKRICWGPGNLHHGLFRDPGSGSEPRVRTVPGARPARELVMGKASVLVVEDNPMSRATAVDMFIDLGFAVFDAYNGYHALALLERHPEISLLFVDVRMPGMSGPELAELVRQRRPDIKIVLTAGYVSEESLASDVHFVPKPWRVDQVAKAVGGCQA